MRLPSVEEDTFLICYISFTTILVDFLVVPSRFAETIKLLHHFCFLKKPSVSKKQRQNILLYEWSEFLQESRKNFNDESRLYISQIIIIVFFITFFIVELFSFSSSANWCVLSWLRLIMNVEKIWKVRAHGRANCFLTKKKYQWLESNTFRVFFI